MTNHSDSQLPAPASRIFELVNRLSTVEKELANHLGPGTDAVFDSGGHAYLLRQAQVALQQSENRFRALIEHSTDVIALLAADATVLYDSPSVTRVLGYTPNELRGRKFLDFFHPEDQARATAVFAELCATPRKSATVALRCRHKSGAYHWLEGTGTNLLEEPGVNAVVLNYRDVTERKDAEAKLHLQSTGLTAAANSIVITDRDGTIVWANPAFSTLSGYTLAEVAGKNLRDLVKSGQHEHAFYQQLWETILAGRVWRGELINRRKDGSLYTEEQTITPVRDAAGTISHFIAIKQDLTARKQAEATLLASEQEFRSLAESMPQIVWVTRPDGWNIYFNQQWVDYTGLTLEESYGHGWNTPFHPDDKQRAWDAWQNATQNDATYSVECRLRRADGAYRWWLIRGVPLRDASGKILKWFGTCTDIENIKQGEAALRQSEERYRLLFDNNPLPMWVFDLETLRFLAVNASAVRHYGYSREEFLALTLKDIRPEEETPALRLAVAALKEDGSGTFESRHRLKNGSIIQVQVVVRLIVFDGHRAGMVLATDVTEKKLIEKRFLHAQRLESVGMLAAGIAHDLNNVLAPIVFAAPMLRDSLTSERDIKILDTLEASAGRGTSLVKQILGFVRTSSDEFRPTQLKHIMRDIAEVIEQTFPKSIQLEHHVPTNLSPVQGNATQIHQVLLNLCVNARDAMPQGGTLRLVAANRQLDAAEAAAIPDAKPGAWLMLEVGDTGTGIPPEALERIWTPFFTTKGPDQGTGLGLTTVRSIVLNHHGFIELHTAAGRGTTFRIYLPAADSDTPRASTASPFGQADGRGELILVVDDDVAIRDVIATVLNKRGYRTFACADGAEAITKFTTQLGQFSLVVTDVDMPRLGGVALAQALLKLHPEIRILAISGHSRSATGTSDIPAMRALAHAFLTKPFTPAVLLKTVGEILHPTAKP